MENGLTPGDGDLSRMCKMFEESEQATADARQKAERDRDYYDNKQWTAEEEAELKKRRQPVVVFNRIQRKVDALRGLEQQTRKDPKAFPRNPQDEASAHAASDAIRYVCDDCRWDDRRSDAFNNLAIEGTGAVMVGVKKTKQGLDPDLIRIPWDRLFWDPHSAEFDFSDANYMGIVIWQDLDTAVQNHPQKKEMLEATWMGGRDSDTYDDKPKNHLWADYKRKRVRIVEMYYRKGGVWHFCIFTKGGFLVEPQESPYRDEDGPENPIKAVSLYIDRDNNRYGAVRTMIGPQDEINKRRSKALHLISQRQVRVSTATGQDSETVRKELSKPDGVFTGEKDEFEILPTNDMAAANLQLLQEAKAEIDLLGPNASLSGKNEADLSGRAIIAQQQGGMLEAGTLMDRVRYLSLAVYRSIWCRIRQHWDGERWIRITDDERNLRFVGLNRPVTAVEAAAEQYGVTQDNWQQFAQERPQEAQQLAMLAQSPMGQQVVRIENSLAELDVDITIDEGIDTPTVAAEQFDTLAKIMPGLTQLPPAYAKMLVQASSLRDKDKMLEALEEMEQGAQIPPELQQQMEEMSQALQQLQAENMQLKTDVEGKAMDRQVKAAEIELKKGELGVKGEELQVKRQELGIKQFEAETQRIEMAQPLTEAKERNEKADTRADQLGQTVERLAEIVAEIAKPRKRTPIRDANGFITEIRDEAA